jgi:ABC-type Fe3+/spermidine/putrescine transport system ATPase subunit
MMNQGSIRWIGSLQQIYQRASSRFVADFVGTTNSLKGLLIGVAGLQAGADQDLARSLTPSTQVGPL